MQAALEDDIERVSSLCSTSGCGEQQAESIQVSVSTNDGETCELTAAPDEIVKEAVAKCLGHKSTGIHIQCIQLGDYAVDDARTFSEEGIETGARLMVVLGVPGRKYAEFDSHQKAAVVSSALDQLSCLSKLSNSELTGILVSLLDDYIVESEEEEDGYVVEEYEVEFFENGDENKAWGYISQQHERSRALEELVELGKAVLTELLENAERHEDEGDKEMCDLLDVVNTMLTYWFYDYPEPFGNERDGREWIGEKLMRPGFLLIGKFPSLLRRTPQPVVENLILPMIRTLLCSGNEVELTEIREDTTRPEGQDYVWSMMEMIEFGDTGDGIGLHYRDRTFSTVFHEHIARMWARIDEREALNARALRPPRDYRQTKRGAEGKLTTW